MNATQKENEKIKKEKSSEEILIEGFAFSISLMISGVVLLFIPDFFRVELLTKGIAYAIIFAGLFSVGGDLNKLNGSKTTIGLDDFALGIFFIFSSILIHNYFTHIFFNVVTALVFFFGTYGTLKGTIHLTFGVYKTQVKSEAWIKGIITVISFITALITLYETFRKTGLLK